MGGEEVVTLDESDEMELDQEERSGGDDGMMKLLPRMPVRVLLAEGDDSTRQIIAALLRKCGYLVNAVSNGMKAWEALKGKTCSIDLVLTEVDLPLMSGFILLSTIMEDEKCKNIPVIMMSSHDSMSMVFKCMMKGAADFLVKPIRKNELRNLWQHVWRKQIARDGGAGLKENTDHDVDLATRHERGSHLAKRDLLIENVGCELRKNQESSGHESDAQSSCTRSDMEAESKHVHTILEFRNQTRILSPPNGANIQNGEANNRTLVDERILPTGRPDCDTDEKACAANEQNGISENKLYGTSRDESDKQRSDQEKYGSHVPHLELSLQGFQSGNADKQEKNDKVALNHSSSSPFSFYNCRTVRTSGNCSDGRGCSGSGANFDLEAMPVESAALPQDVRVGRRTPVKVLPFNVPTGGLQCYWNGLSMPSIFYPQSAHPVWSTSGKEATGLTGSSQPVDRNGPTTTASEDSQDQTAGPSCHSVEGHDNAKFCLDGQRLASAKTRDSTSTVREDNAMAPLTSSSYSCAAAITGHGDSCNTFIPEIAMGDDQHHLSQRELALNRFRLKRKERCFAKKVRYQSRKMLAEQRPRVKGQFVRQDQLVQGIQDGQHP